MGETRTVHPSERTNLPGLTRPYINDDSKITDRGLKGCRMNGKQNRLDTRSTDPYSIYDDDSQRTHYFLVPGGHTDLKRFGKTFREMNRTDKTQQTHVFVPSSKTSCQRSSTTRFNSESSGEYCMLSKDAKIEKCDSMRIHNPSTIHRPHIKKENLEKFAEKFVSSNSAECKCSKDNSFVEFDFNRDSSCTKLKRKKKLDNIIDICTCMICVRAVSYHCTSDDTDEFVQPCSCTGSTKSVFGRWLCMGVLAVFFPCLMCYLPAKLCQNSTSESCSRTKLKHDDNDDSYKVRFVRDLNDNNNDSPHDL